MSTKEDQAELKQLLVEAHEMGLQYTGDDPVELYAIVMQERGKRGREVPVPCFSKSYDSIDRRCRICQLREACSDQDPNPRIAPPASKLQPIPCDACGKGFLDDPTVVEGTDEIRDYACTTPGCQNSVAVQCGWEEVGGQIASEIVLGETEPDPEPEDKPTKPTKPKTVLQVIEGGASRRPGSRL